MNQNHLQFLWLYSKTQLTLKYRYSYLGFIWNFFEPALYLLVLGIVFSVVNQMSLSDYVVYLFAGLVPWRYFENTVNTAMESIVGGEWLLKKIHVSPFVFPLTRWVVASFEFLFAFIVMFVFFLIFKQDWTLHLLILPLSTLVWAIFALGVGLILAVIYTFFRDIKPIITMLMMFAFFSSPILIKVDIFKDYALQSTLMQWHPLTYFVHLFQKPIYFNVSPSFLDWSVSITISSLLLILGIYLVNKYKSKFYYYL
jgi:ABC-type polysaccharide/polyol phosphate export permease